MNTIFISTIVLMLFKIDGDDKTIRNSSNSLVLKIDGNDIRNSSSS